MDLVETGSGGVDWIGLPQDRDKGRALVSSVRKSSGSIKCWETVEWPYSWWSLKWCSVP
jgi:hypothetical protein